MGCYGTLILRINVSCVSKIPIYISSLFAHSVCMMFKQNGKANGLCGRANQIRSSNSATHSKISLQMSFLNFSFNQNKTFKPLKKSAKSNQEEQLRHIAQQTLESGNLNLAVVLPAGEDINEWLAINCVDF